LKNRLCFLSLWALLGCDANVVDAVREPLPVPMPSTSSTTPVPPPNPLETTLLHRYSFEGTGTEVRDAKGASHGTLLGTELPGTGQLPLEGARTGQYVDLADGIISGLSNATFEAWLIWDGGGAWQRIFDFGSSSGGEDMAGSTGISYLFFAASSTPGPPRLVFSRNGVDDEQICAAPDAFPIGVLTHIVAVINRTERRMAIYQDGELAADCPLERPLSDINDVNNWLGHSNFIADVDLAATYEEFRIYGAALSATELRASFAAGPDAGR